MTRTWWKQVWNMPKAALALGVLAAVGCTPETTTTSTSSSGSTPTQCQGDNPEPCKVARDCGGGYACVLQDGGTDGCCVKLLCESDADCTAPEKCNTRRGICELEGCTEGACSAGEVCINATDDQGRATFSCEDPGEIAADKCTLDTTRFSLRTGESRTLQPTGFLNSGAVVSFARFSFMSSMTGAATVDDDGVVTGAGTGTSTITVTPLPSGTPCTAEVTVYGNVAANDARAVVFNSRNGRPVAGAQVQLRTTAAPAAPVVVETDAQGVAAFPAVGAVGDILDVTAFAADYTWVTYSRPGANDLAFYLDPIDDPDQIAGITGTFDHTNAPAPPGESGDVKLGLAAFSIAGALSDLNLTALIGETVETDIVIPSININQQDVPLPSGVFLKLVNDDIKSRIDVYADGPCTAEDPCNRVLWGLGGQIGLSKLGPIVSQVAGGTDSIDAGKILSAVLPFFRRFYHAMGGTYSVVDQAAPAEGTLPTFPNNDVVVKPNYALNKAAVWTVPNLPALPGQSTETVSGALVLTGSLVPGQGMVPLGITAGLDECPEESQTSECIHSGTADGQVACADDKSTRNYNECDGLAAGDVVADYAPPHDGLEAYRFATVAVALDVDSLGAGSLFTSVLVSFDDDVTPAGSGKNTFPISNFLGFNQGKWTASTRTYAATSAVTGADFYRLNMDTNGNPWFVYFTATGSTFSVEVPPVPAMVTGDRVANLDIQAFKFLPGAGIPTSLQDLAGFNSTNFDSQVNYTGGFSTQECVAIYPARECTGNDTCAAGFSDDYTCDTTAGVCVNEAAGVTVKGTGACPAGTRELTAGTKTVCSRIPACEIEE